MRRTLITLAVAVAVRTATADPVCNASDAAAEAAALRVHLRDESARADRWNVGWGIGYGTAAAAQLGLAIARWNPIGDYNRSFRDTLLVGAGKAALGALSRGFAPLRVEVPAAVADPCADVVALRGALARAARRERALFWTSHIGSLVVNLGGSAIVADRASWSVAAVTFAIGYPIGLLGAYTMPRGSWHAWRTLQPTAIAPVPIAGGGVALTIAGTF